jgi:transposase
VAHRGRPAGAVSWVRERELKVVVDNYSVHKSEVVARAEPELERAGIKLEYLPSYSPELSRIEPDWNDVKQQHLPKRSYETVAELKRAVDEGLGRKATLLQQAQAKLRVSGS